MSLREERIEQEVRKLAASVAEYQDIDIVEVKLFGKGRRTLLRITIDKIGGVALDECARFSRNLDPMLEAGGVIEGAYTLEVSSPGLDRPLIAHSDFEKSKGKLVRVIVKDKIDNQNFFIGRIIGVTADSVHLLIGKEERVIPLVNISKARLEIEII
ncbi:MAG: ribosome maturation factor RimP [Nitrospirae bacterium]|nr:ribosome maturation factor RimP [Nitrospirota bacterium]